jgi:hypothetical protein
MMHTKGIVVGMVIISLALAGVMSCHDSERKAQNPTAPHTQGGDRSVLSNYAQMEGGSTVVDGQQLNWVISDWGTLPYNQWMYLEVNEQDAIGKAPGDHQIPVTLGNVVLSFSGLPAAVREILIGVKAVHDANDQTFTERGRFAVVDGRVEIPLDYGDLVNYFGVTHYSIWFQALSDANGRACGQIALSGVMPSGQNVTFSKQVCFGTNPIPACQLNLANPCQVKNNADSGTDSLRGVLALGICATITFACGVTDIQLTSVITNDDIHLDITSNVTLDGGSGVTIRGSTSRVFRVNSGVSATLTGLTITGGNSLTNGGGGIYNLEMLTIGATTVVSGNNVWGGNHGGGINNSGGALTVEGKISGNHADGAGGGIFNDNSGTVTISTGGQVTGNTAGTCYNYWDNTGGGTCVIGP